MQNVALSSNDFKAIKERTEATQRNQEFNERKRLYFEQLEAAQDQMAQELWDAVVVEFRPSQWNLALIQFVLGPINWHSYEEDPVYSNYKEQQ